MADIITKPVINSYYEFLEFIKKNNIMSLGMAFIIGTQVNSLASSFIDSIVSPIIKTVSTTQNKKLKDINVEVLGAKIEIGNFVNELLKFLLTMLIIFYIFKLLDITD